MKNIFIINAHQKNDYSPGKLNASLTQRAKELFEKKGYETRITAAEADYDIQQEIKNHQWADVILIQSPTYWMGFPWVFKKYMDDVYTAGMAGQLCDGDGRHRPNYKENYGAGGTLQGKQYMLSLTFNAPIEAFNTPDEYLFQGKSVDDLFFPAHMNFRFFAMEALPTFSCHDIMKDPHIEDDFQRFEKHLDQHI
ncbi:NAD(P)H-dependent oxidoreductase [Rubritalea sp.]|uniref:NAD(P)H-dependent oxidoreductase n=1 Tax=Rubritalea sp. TaxID=2109375 RepID=UPI003EF96C6C